MEGALEDEPDDGTTDVGVVNGLPGPVGLGDGRGADGAGVGGAVGVGAGLGRGVGGRVGAGVGGLVEVATMVTTPDICSEWNSQKYGKVPTLAKVVVNESPEARGPALAG